MSSNNKVTQHLDSTFDVSRLCFTNLEETSRSKGQKIAYPRYKTGDGKDSSLVLQTPFIQITSYGIPKKSDFYKTESDRSFIKVPLDPEQSQEVKEMYEKLKEIDVHLTEDGGIKETIFGSARSAKQYKYQPIVRQPVVMETVDSDSDSDDDTKDTSKKDMPFRPDYFKAKFRIDWDSKELTTKFYEKIKDEETGKFKRKLIEGVKSIAEAQNHIRYQGKVRLVMIPNKLWVMKNYEGKKYGMSFKVTHVEVEQRPKTSNMKEILDGDAFISDSDEGDDDDDEKGEEKLELGNNDELSDSDDDSDDTDSETLDTAVTKKKPAKRKGGKKLSV
jgi:hypothetical protein